MSAEIKIIFENDGNGEHCWEYIVHSEVSAMTLKQLFYEALSRKYGLDVKIRLSNGEKTD